MEVMVISRTVIGIIKKRESQALFNTAAIVQARQPDSSLVAIVSCLPSSY